MQKTLAILIVLLLPIAAHAAADPYVVTGVPVDVTADTAAKARDQAIREGHRKAFETLAKQLFPNKPAPKVTDKTLGNMVSDFRVDQEQATANRYVATLTFRFRQNQVRAAYGSRALPSPKQLAERLQNPDAVVADADAATGAEDNLDQIIAQETKKPSDRGDAVYDTVSAAPPPGNALLVQVTARNSRELDNAIGRFRDVSQVREVEYVSITPEKSILRLSFGGEEAALMAQMQSSGIVLRADTATRPPLYILEP